MQLLAAATVLVAAATLASGQSGTCEVDTTPGCSADISVKGQVKHLNFRRLCNPSRDYSATDGASGHVYKAQICGLVSARCLPKNYNIQYEFGRVVQFIDAADPPCDNSCVDERTGQPTCCTGACEIPAIGPGVISALNGDPMQGIVISYVGTTPTLNDPWQCPVNPATGNFYPRTTEYQFKCDHSVTGFAVLESVLQNTSDSCDYTLKFKTNLVCFGDLPISGGWIFMIILLGGFGLYVIGGYAYSYARLKTFVFPNQEFWSEVNDLIFEGVVFVCSLGKKRARKTGAKEPSSFKPMFVGGASSSDSVSAVGGFQSVGSEPPAGAGAPQGNFADL